MTIKHLGIVFFALLTSINLQANTLLPDSVWTFKDPNAHHHTQENEIWLSADRPGAGTGSEVLTKGVIQWNEWAPTPDIFASLGVNFEPTDHLGLFIESFNLFDPDAVDLMTGKNYTHSHVSLDFGVTYAVHPRVQLDAYAGFNIYNSEPMMSYPQNYAFFGLGVTWLICKL